MITKNHQFFILESSPWPLISALNSFSMFMSGLIFIKFGYTKCFFTSCSSIFLASLIWWSFYSGEFNLEGKNSLTLEQGLKYSMLLFISSEVFFFFSFFWSYFHFYLSPCMDISMTWPPLKIFMFEYMNVPLINTLTLITSGLTITISHFYMMKNYMKMSKMLLFATIILGMIFTILQMMEYNSALFDISDSNFGSTFFMLTGFHGIHVIVGTTFLMVCLYRCNKLTPHKKECLSMEMAAWYWHFVDVVWIFLYFILYYMNN